MADVSGLPSHQYGAALPPGWEHAVTAWLREDIPSFDYGGYVVGDALETATLYCKAKGILAGCPFFDEVFRQCHCTVEWYYAEGQELQPLPDSNRLPVALVSGSARHLLAGERCALNILARASGIASSAREVVAIKNAHGFQGAVAGTRKTTPGFRLVEKYALLVGGAATHRMDLSSMVMLKDNHIWSQGNITKAVHSARAVAGFSLKIEVECGSLDAAREAIAAGADVVMLDNFTPEDLKTAAATLKQETPHVLIEASGGITSATLSQYFCPHVDVCSLGSLTQGYPFVDFSLKITKKK